MFLKNKSKWNVKSHQLIKPLCPVFGYSITACLWTTKLFICVLQWLWTDYLSGNKGTLPTLDVSQKVWMSFLLHPAEIRAHVVWLRSRLPRLLFWLGSHSVCPHWLEEQHSVLTLWTQACHPSGQKTKVRTMANNIYIYISIYLCCSFILTHFNAATYISTVIVALCLSNTSISSFIMVEGILQRPH